MPATLYADAEAAEARLEAAQADMDLADELGDAAAYQRAHQAYRASLAEAVALAEEIFEIEETAGLARMREDRAEYFGRVL